MDLWKEASSPRSHLEFVSVITSRLPTCFVAIMMQSLDIVCICSTEEAQVDGEEAHPHVNGYFTARIVILIDL